MQSISAVPRKKVVWPRETTDRVSSQNRKVLHFVVSGDFHTDLPLR